MNIGDKIKKIREVNGHSLTDLSKRVNVDKAHLSRIENNKKTPNLELLSAIADTYNIHISDFFGEKIPMPDPLKDVGVEWIAFAKERQEENLTVEETKKLLEFAKKIKRDVENI